MSRAASPVVDAAASATTLPSRLRTATRASHERLERITALPASIRTAAELRAVLEDLYGFHVVAEAAGARAALATLPGFDDAFGRDLPPSAWLASDMATLGATATRIAALPRCTALGPFPTGAARLGCAYVLEGSTLGGRIIHAHLARGEIAVPALRFFEGHGADTARRWKAFTRALDARERPASDDAETLAAAEATFRVLGDWFEARARARHPRHTDGGASARGGRRAASGTAGRADAERHHS